MTVTAWFCICGVCADARGGCPVSCAVVLYLTHLRKELLLNLELNWWPADPMVPQPWGRACAQLFTQVLGVWNQVLRLVQQVLLPGTAFLFLLSSLPSRSLLPPSLLCVCIYVCVCTWESILFLYLVSLRDRTWVSRWWHLYTLSYLICPGFTFKDMCAFYTLAKDQEAVHFWLLFGDSYGFFKLTITYVMINPSFKIKLKTCFL